MFCKNCGVQVTDDALFCHNCGTALSEPIITATQGVQSIQSAECGQPQNPTTPPASQAPYTSPNMYTVPPYQPTVPTQPERDNSKNGFAVSSLILGIFGLLPCGLNIVPAILALIFGILGKKSGRSAMATAGLVLAIVGLSLTALIIILGIAEGEATIYDNGYYGDYGMYF